MNINIIDLKRSLNISWSKQELTGFSVSFGFSFFSLSSSSDSSSEDSSSDDFAFSFSFAFSSFFSSSYKKITLKFRYQTKFTLKHQCGSINLINKHSWFLKECMTCSIPRIRIKETHLPQIIYLFDYYSTYLYFILVILVFIA